MCTLNYSTTFLELALHGISAVCALDGVGGGVRHPAAPVLVPQHLHLPVQQVLPKQTWSKGKILNQLEGTINL